MDSFNIVMEKIDIDNATMDKMQEALNDMRNTLKSKEMKLVKTSLNEARNLAKKGNKEEAKKKYQECLINLDVVQKRLTRSYESIFTSGDYNVGNYQRKYIISTIAYFAFTIAMIASVLTKNSFAKHSDKAEVAAGLSYLVVNREKALRGPQDKKNYKAFVKKVNENPKKVFSEILTVIKTMKKTITKEIKDLDH